MLGKLKEIFSSGPSSQPGGRRGRVNLQRRFSIVSETARGSMSRVYRAIDNQTGRTVCLKVQKREKNEAAAARTSTRETRPPEGEVASQLVHPHIVRTFEYGTSTQGEHYLAMEYIDGVSFQYIRETRSARTAQKVELLAQAAEGLAAVHAAGFIHHDINPRNFLVDRGQQVKLIDFGLSVPNTPAFCRPGNRTGTVQYMAPELLRREPIDERIDIFAFGVLAFELLTDRLPYDASNTTTMMLQRINMEPLDPAVVKPKLSEELCQILRQLTARRREQRWARLSTLPEALRSIPAKRQRV
ncbi:MAG TPA: serine/threonine-protein kinase [Isosphaeraceae bacterium]|jgi:serine/threonine protein kinase|nr:serine/threonine-protein kinase [Isosphaeraceae bacterium]